MGLWDPVTLALISGSKKKEMTMAMIWVSGSYLDEEVDDHDDATALLDTSFPRREGVIVVAVDDDQVDEDEPDDVDRNGDHEDDHDHVLVALPLAEGTLR